VLGKRFFIISERVGNMEEARIIPEIDISSVEVS
jgi:hypothetical protein